MKSYNASVLILSCDKNYDLYKWINRTCDCFLNLGIECVLVTENDIDNFDKRINSFATHNNNFDERFIFGVEQCKNDNIIVLLDDYYIHDVHLDIKLNNWLEVMEKEQLIALRIASIKKMYIKKQKIKKKYYLLSRIQPYEIDFHPTIWNKKELLALIKNRRFSPRSLEPCFALYLEDKKSGITKETIQYDELIIQGAFFKKSYKRYCSREYEGNKRIAKGRKFVARSFKVFIFNISPYWVVHLLRKLFKIKSVSAEAEL